MEKEEKKDESSSRDGITDSEKEGGKDSKESKRFFSGEISGNVMGPEGMMMFGIAFFVDFTEMVLDISALVLNFFFGVGLFLHAISAYLDVIAAFIFGFWLFMRRGTKRDLMGEKERAKASFLRSKIFYFIFELLPVISFLYPGWIMMVYREIRGR